MNSGDLNAGLVWFSNGRQQSDADVFDPIYYIIEILKIWIHT